ncbi:sortase [Chloroflexus sp.]|uniref:sortase n=1 Tax=Chloroflexus sp. TaxID=1904827 RepID=UPI00298EE02E|nr:sortase [Chloroflexus sp.]MDW8402808.1 sortase [Chloroflexus sp.]
MLHRFPTFSERIWRMIGVRRIAPARRGPWLFGTALMLLGAGLLIYVLVTTLQIEYYRWAARGDSPLPAPQVTTSGFRPADARPLPLLPDLAAVSPTVPATAGNPTVSAEKASATTGTLSQVNSGLLISEPPDPVRAEWVATVERLVIPAIRVDFKVIEVGWETIEENGQLISVWQVAEYAVGQHRGSANPGEGDNIVLAGHVGGYGRVFKDLFYLKPGDEVIVYSRGQPYRYIVSERIIVDEEGVPPEQRLANARYIAPTGYEVVTMVTCWPPSGPDKFKQRVIVRALPVQTTDNGTALPDGTR